MYRKCPQCINDFQLNIAGKIFKLQNAVMNCIEVRDIWNTGTDVCFVKKR